MRGKAASGFLSALVCRITPAYAGKSYLIGTGLSDTKDHPRVCGEKTVLDLSRLVEQGSPPRMRGKEVVFIDSYLVSRITPAYAGKRFDPIHRITFQRDHPRVCGEKITGGNLLPVNKGSPPRMRGKANKGFAFLDKVRITPAYAGKSSCSAYCGRGRKDHPRVCGEKRKCAAQHIRTLGSPPRMRGKD